jgi:hypothetical protein
MLARLDIYIHGSALMVVAPPKPALSANSVSIRSRRFFNTIDAVSPSRSPHRRRVAFVAEADERGDITNLVAPRALSGVANFLRCQPSGTGKWVRAARYTPMVKVARPGNRTWGGQSVCPNSSACMSPSARMETTTRRLCFISPSVSPSLPVGKRDGAAERGRLVGTDLPLRLASLP